MGRRMGQPVIVTTAAAEGADPAAAFAAGAAAVTAIVATETADEAAALAAAAASNAGEALDAAAGAAGGVLDVHDRIDALEEWIEDRLDDIARILGPEAAAPAVDDGAPPIIEAPGAQVVIPEPAPTKEPKPVRRARGFGSDTWFGNR